jgi:cell division septum initiation protein DivIVA
MGQSTEELTSQIEDTRQRMASDLDTLQDRVSPSAIVERRKQAVRGGISSMKEKVMGTAQSASGSMSGAVSGTGSSVASTAQERFDGAPLAAGAVAFGAGLVLASLLPATRAEAEAAHRVVETAKEQGQPLLDEARAAGEQVVESARQSATESAQQVQEAAQESARTVSDEARSSTESVRDQAQG